MLMPAIAVAERMSCQEVVITKLLYNGSLIASQLQPTVNEYEASKMDWVGTTISTFHQAKRFQTFPASGISQEQSQKMLETFLFTYGEGKETLVKVSRQLPITGWLTAKGDWEKGQLAHIEVKMPGQKRHHVGKEVSEFKNSKSLSKLVVVPGAEFNADVKDNAFQIAAPMGKMGDALEYVQEYSIDCGTKPPLESTTIEVFDGARDEGKAPEGEETPGPPPPPPGQPT